MPPVESLPTKPKKAAPAQHEIDAFVEKYELYSDIYGDPVEIAFRIMGHNVDKANEDRDEEVALRAADMLMSYRYPRIKAIQGADGPKGPQFTFNIDLTGRAPELQVKTFEARELPTVVALSPGAVQAISETPVVDLSGIFE